MKATYPVFLGALLTPLLLMSQPAAANVDIVFDYRYDSSGFFTGANSSRQNLLNSAASVFETRFQEGELIEGKRTPLTAISSSVSNGFHARFFQPDNGKIINIPNYSVAADQIVVFVGAYNIPGSLAVGGPGGFTVNGSAAFHENVLSRGQPGALLPTQTDYGPWGGRISFNSMSNWYFDPDVTTSEPFSNQYDFYSVAVHELAHVLGFASAPSFNNLVSGGVFTGTAVNSLFGSNPSVASDGHWASGLSYLGQEAAMDPSIAVNERKHFTELDFAAMKDAGWQVSPIPETEIWAMMLAGLGLFGWRLRPSQRRG